MDKISNILSELYELDPQLKTHEAKLRVVIEKLLAAQPTIKLNQAFVKKLRAQLLAQTTSGETKSFNVNFMNLQKFGYLLGGAAIASLVIIPTVLTQLPKNNFQSLNIDGQPQINLLTDGAFGTIQTSVSQSESSATGAVAAPTVARDMATISVRPQSGGGAGLAMVTPDSKMMIYPGPERLTQFKYVYAGEALDLGHDKLEVLRRKTSWPKVGSLAGGFSLGLFDQSKIANLRFENVMMSEGNNGIRVSTDFNIGEVFISHDSAYGYATDEYQPIQPKDVPAADELINLANAFIKQFGIKLTNYGQPQVMAANRFAVETRLANPDMYIPDVFTVIYPLSIKELPVYDQGGNPSGITINISLRTKQVVSVTGLNTQNYDASLYPIESSIATLLDKYQNQNNYYPEGVQVDTVTINLGTPKLVLTTIYSYANNQQQYLLVPAYLFPVQDKPKEYSWMSDSLIIPLVAGLDGAQPGQIMPLMMKGASGGATEPAVAPMPPTIDPAVK